MFDRLLLVCMLLCVPLVKSHCYSKSSRIKICNDQSTSNASKATNIDYQTVLHTETFERFFLKNYQLPVFIIDDYPLNLRVFNASDNRFQTIIITSKNRYLSNLRQLILRSNDIEQFHIETITLPESLEIISLANNRLEVLDARIFFHLPNLTQLDLRNNRLKRILPQLVLKMNIRMNNNPLDCQCTPDFYRMRCENATSLTPSTSENELCVTPHYDPQSNDTHKLSYLRFSTFVLICPIRAHPPPLIIWSTPFGNLTSINSSNIDLLSSDTDKLIYAKLTASAGPLTARTRHRLYAFEGNHLSVTQARAGLRRSLSCSATNMLGTYTYEFDIAVDTYMQKRALRNMLFTLLFGFVLALIGGALCFILRQTNYLPNENTKTPPIYPTMTPNSATRTPPNFELNQWLSLAAANISDTLEQVRDKLRLGVQQVSEHMGQTMGRASELISSGVQHAGGTIRQAAEASVAYFQSFRETSQQRLNTIRVQTLTSLRTSGNFMRTGMNMLTTQVNSLRDYCGVTTGHLVPTNYLLQQHQLHMEYSPIATPYLHQNQTSTIIEDDDETNEDRSPYAGHLPSVVFGNLSGIGRLDTADNSVLLALDNFNQNVINTTDNEELAAQGQMAGGLGTFHGRIPDLNGELVIEPERLTIYGEQRPVA